MSVDYKPDRGGVAELLKSFGPLVNGLATQVAGNVLAQRPDSDVVTDSYTTDRAAASVTIREPEAMILQVRDGILTKAAAAAGLEVRAE